MAKKKLVQSLVVAIFGLLPTASFAIDYDCRLPNDQSGYIPPQIIIRYDETSAAVAVWDWMISEYVGQPVIGKVTEHTNRKVVFSWSYAFSNRFGQNAKMTYRASIQTGSGRANVSAVPSGFNSRYSARGSCTTTQ